MTVRDLTRVVRRDRRRTQARAKSFRFWLDGLVWGRSGLRRKRLEGPPNKFEG
jgi:hypothetical protein